MVKVAPSILSGDFADMGASARMLEASGADWLHCDVMDGVFVPNITFGQPMVAALRRSCGLFMDVHLMIADPARYIEGFAEAGADVITVHAEACGHLHRVLQQIRKCGKLAGVSLNPATPPETVDWVLDEADLVLVMSVNPGFGGQKFIPSALDKVAAIAERRARRGLSFILEVDGGVTPENAKSLRDAGATALVAGSAVFSSPDPAKAIRLIRGEA